MNISIEDFFKNSFVISLYQERFDLFKQIFEYHNLLIPKKYEGISFKTSSTKWWNDKAEQATIFIKKCFGCFASHQAVIRMAKMFDLPFVCVFEDDAYPCIDIKKKLEYYLTDIPDDVDCLVLGNLQLNSCVKINDKYYKLKSNNIGNFSGAHAYVVFNKAYNDYIKISQDRDYVCDHTFMLLNNVYSPVYNLFIQYNQTSSISFDNSNYQWIGRSGRQIFKEFPKIEDILNAEIS